jgi:hypothetical protein
MEVANAAEKLSEINEHPYRSAAAVAKSTAAVEP